MSSTGLTSVQASQEPAADPTYTEAEVHGRPGRSGPGL